MPINYLNFQQPNVSTTGSVVYTASQTAQATIIGLLLANTGNTTTNATVTLTNSSNTVTTNIIKNVTIYTGSTLDIINSSKIIVQSGSNITVYSPGSIDATLSVIEVT